MSRALRRPVWQYMGWWKWPSMALLLFCAVAIYLYFDLAPGGAAHWGAHSFDGRLAGCPIHAGAEMTAEGLSLMVRIDPACAWKLAEPQVMITSAAGKTLHSRDIGGLPNPDRLQIQLPDAAAETAQYYLELTARDRRGLRHAARWALPPPVAPSPP